MKHVSLFNDFLKDTVNLNSTRVTLLENSVTTIKSVVNGSAWEPEIIEWAAQGSWAHQTIIRPVDAGEFDADLLVFVKPVAGWTAAQYIQSLYEVFEAHGTYKGKCKRWSHCVTITYANERKIDVAPCVVDRGGFTRFEVCNRDSNEFEQSEPKRYTDWLINKNSLSGSNSFRKVTRLLKYLRDIKTTFTCPSVLLTTLLGYRVQGLDRGSADFADVPTSLKTLIGRLDDWLQMYAAKPSVTNPFLASEDFGSLWSDDTQYTNFRSVIHRYRGWIDDAFAETDRNESIGKWRRVFGESFAAAVVLEDAKSISKSAANWITETARIASDFRGDLVAAVRQFGSRALPPGFDNLPHMSRPIWRVVDGLVATVEIRAERYDAKNGNLLGVVSSLELLQPGYWLRFTAFNQRTSLAFSTNDYEVRWRVTNTDEAAALQRALRGDFYPSHTGHTRWEELTYRGVHLVEAFLIRRRDNRLAGRSAPFRVMIN